MLIPNRPASSQLSLLKEQESSTCIGTPSNILFLLKPGSVFALLYAPAAGTTSLASGTLYSNCIEIPAYEHRLAKAAVEDVSVVVAVLCGASTGGRRMASIAAHIKHFIRSWPPKDSASSR